MIRNFFSLFVTWIFTIQATIVFPVQASEQMPKAQNTATDAIAHYNSYAADPTKSSPKGFSKNNEMIVKEFIKNNNIHSALPIAKLTPSGIEMTANGQTFLIEVIDQKHEILRINGKYLALSKHKNDFKGLLAQLEKMFLEKKSTKNKKFVNSVIPSKSVFESLVSIIISNANADCLSKYDAKINEIFPETLARSEYNAQDKSEKIQGGSILGIAIILAYFVNPALGIVAFLGTSNMKNLRKDPYINERHQSFDPTVISNSILVAKSNNFPKGDFHISETLADAEAQHNWEVEYSYIMEASGTDKAERDELKYGHQVDHFHQLYKLYKDAAVKLGSTPVISKENFRKALVEADKNESICSSKLMTIDEVVVFMARPKDLDPNHLIMNTSAVTKPENEKEVDTTKRDSKPSEQGETISVKHGSQVIGK